MNHFYRVYHLEKSGSFKVSAFVLAFLLLISPVAQVFADNTAPVTTPTTTAPTTTNTTDTATPSAQENTTPSTATSSASTATPTPSTTTTDTSTASTSAPAQSDATATTTPATKTPLINQSKVTPPPVPGPVVSTMDTRQLVPQPDPATGAMVYGYKIDVPPGRNGIQPDLSLQYNSQQANQNSIFGYGWSINIPYIQRVNKKGSSTLYTDNYFSSSLSGDLINVSGSTYAPRVEKGDFLKYTYASNTWTVTDKSGTVYTFGSVAATRQDDPGNSAHIYKWMLEKELDTNGNYITYSYFKDSGQIYPDTITYTSNGSNTGIFTVVFTHTSRTDVMTDAVPDFVSTTNYLISQIQVNVSGTWVKKYALAYTSQSPLTRSLLASITKSGQASSVVTTLPADTFTYQPVTTNQWTYDASWTLPDDQFEIDLAASSGNPVLQINGHNAKVGIGNNSLDGHKSTQFVDVNGDGLPDIVEGYRCQPGTCTSVGSPSFNGNYVYLNTGHGWVYDATWTIPDDQFEIDFAAATGNSVMQIAGANAKLGLGTPSTDGHKSTQFVDVNGDGLPDIIEGYRCLNNGICMASTGTAMNGNYVYLNTGHGWTYNSAWSIPADQYEIDYATASGGTVPQVGGANVKIGLGTNVNDGHKLTQFVDVNGDGLPDVVEGYRCLNDNHCLPTTATGFDGNYVYLNTGSGWVYDSTWSIPADQFEVDLSTSSGNPILQVGGHNAKLGLGSNPADGHKSTQFVDVNGDGLPDIVEGYRCQPSSCTPSTSPAFNGNYVYLNTGNGWVYDSTWTVPDDQYEIDLAAAVGTTVQQIAGANVKLGLGTSTLDTHKSTQFVDVNGDGLPDIIEGYRCLNNGICMATTNPAINGSYVYLNTGHGWAYNSTWGVPPDQYEIDYATNSGGTVPQVNGANVKLGLGNNVNDGHKAPQYIDVNGDKIPDAVQGYRCLNDAHCMATTATAFNGNYIYSSDYKPLILSTVTLGSGGSYSMTYKPVAQYTSAGNAVPFVIQTLNQVTVNDGLGNTGTTTYSYAGGTFYYNSADYTTRKFAGFTTITATDAAGNVTKTYYHTGNGTDTSHGEYADSYPKIGQVYRTENYDGSNNLYLVTINKWDDYNIGTNHDFVKLARTTTLTYDGTGSHKDTAVEYTYDNTYGNLLTKTNWGQVTAANDGSFTDTGTDKSVETISYVAGTSNYVVGLPYDDVTVDQSAAKVNETRTYYDTLALGSVGLGNPTKVEKWVTGTTYVNTQKAYDGTYGIVVTATDENGHSTSYSYDTYHLYPTTVTDALTHTTGYTYDYSSGKVIQTTDQNGFIYQTLYDGLNRVIQQNIPGFTTPYTPVTKATFTYTDTTGAVSVHEVESLDGTNTVDTYSYYDGLNRLIQKRVESETAGSYNVTDYAYNNLGLIQKQSLPYLSNGSAKTTATTTTALYNSFTYDPIERVLSSVNALGTTSYVYNLWKTSVTDPRGKIKDEYTDARGNLIEVDEHNSGSTYVTTYTWNLNGNLLSITDALGNVRHFTYDGLGNRLTAEDLHASADATYGSWSYTYDNVGNLTQSISPLSKTVNYTYDNVNRILTEDYTGGTGTEITYVYDTCTNGIGKLCSVTMTSGANTTYTYDSNSNIASQVKTVNSTAYTTSFTYDRQGNQLVITYPDSSAVSYTYNTAGLLSQVQTKESGGSYANVVSSITHSPTNQPAVITYANGAVTTNTYDASHLYRLSTKVTVNSVPTNLQNITYSYDANENITQIVDASATHAAKTVVYTYDDLNRMLTATATGVPTGQTPYTHTFVYNAIGDITSGPVGTYVYNGSTGTNYANPQAATSINGVTNTYDKDGNVLTDGTLTNTWNYKDQLSTSTNGTFTRTYLYDEGGNRVSSTNGTTTTVYPNKYYTYNGTTKTKDIYAGDELVATITKTGSTVTPQYVHTDHVLGSNIITDASGVQNQLLDYFPYGQVRLNEQVGSFNEQKQYIGQVFDADTTLNYLQARYYKSTIGQFLSEDPVFLGDPKNQHLTDPQSLNSYAYSGNNPITKSDPSGRCFEDGCVVEALAIGGAAGFVGGISLQYISDVKSNIQKNGLSPLDFVSGLSSPKKYLVNGVKGAIVGGTTVAASALGLSATLVGVTTAAATAVTDYGSDLINHQKTDSVGVAVDSALNGVTGGAFELLPGVPGRLPNLFTKSFFTGAHMQNAIAQSFLGTSIASVSSSLVGDSPQNVTVQSNNKKVKK